MQTCFAQPRSLSRTFAAQNVCANLHLMYTRYFGLLHAPFSIAPDPHFLFMSERHREALAHLLYGLDGGGGFVLLTGEIGAGKTTICRLFLEQVPAHCNVAYILNPKQTATELLQSICKEFGVVPVPAMPGTVSAQACIDPLNTFLMAEHAQQKSTILIIDEAQNLTDDVLEQLRLLTNLETNERKLLQIILIGQPELRTILARPEMEQLAQRIVARFHLDALSVVETGAYIGHRLMVAGSERASPFNARVTRRIHALTRGIPRQINLLCDRAMLGAYASGKPQIDLSMIKLAAHEVFDSAHTSSGQRMQRWSWIVGAMAILVLAVGVMAQTGHLMPLAMLIKSAPMYNRLHSQDNAASGMADPRLTPHAPHISDHAAAIDKPLSVAEAVHTLPAVLGVEARDLPAAYRRLGKYWQLMLPDEPDVNSLCKEAQHHNVFCFVSKNGLSDIRRLDRPGIVTLYDHDNHPYYALLSGLNNDNVTLQIGALTQTVTLNALAHRWRGGFMTFWRGPAAVSQIRSNQNNVATDWLATRLAVIAGKSPPATGRVFDESMRTSIREFQLTQGLTPDGLPGPLTLMRLSMAAGDAEPRLFTQASSSRK